jgi:branched-chain amino acid transport system ATP-binding protein
MSCGYGRFRAVHALDLSVQAGTVAALIGPNGAGKSSTIQCIAGHVALHEGRVLFDGADVSGQTPPERATAGIALVPEGRRLFTDLTVRENLLVGSYRRPKSRTAGNMETVLDLFPRLHERLNVLAGVLSGGEQQMAAIGRALMAEPRLLLVDEVSLGLMPKNVDACYAALDRLHRAGMTIVLVEQYTARALEIADRVYVLASGALAWSGSATEARANAALIDAYLGSGRAAQRPPADAC